MKSNLSVFTKAPVGRWRIFQKIVWHCRSLHCAWQRATKGYCYRDLWDLDKHYKWLLYESLTEFKKNLHGAPVDFYDEENDGIEPWTNYIAEMARYFYESIEENEVFKNEYEEEFRRLNPLKWEKTEDGLYRQIDNDDPEAITIRKKWFEREKEITARRELALEMGMSMLTERFSDLWD